MSEHHRRERAASQDDTQPGTASEGTESTLSLIERKTALRILLIGAFALVVLWISEWSSGVIAAHDRWAQPALAAFLASQYWRLRRAPRDLLSAQRSAVAGVALYCVIAMAVAALIDPATLTLQWFASNFMWLPVVSLLIHLTFPWRWAVSLSVALSSIAALPGLWMLGQPPSAEHGHVVRALLINGVLVQATFLIALVAVERFRHGIGLIVAGESEGSADARQALATWLQTHTAELARARDAAESASRAKSRFLAVMSHELRTPLHAMLVSADLLSDRHQDRLDPETEARLLRTIRSSGQHLLTLIDQVLELSRIEAGRVETVSQPLDLHRVVHQACAAVRPMAELKALDLESRVPADLIAHRLGDELRLTQVLINLMANACKFTLQGGVTLAVQALEAPDLPAGVWVRCSVTDTGPGMDETEQSHVFDAFYQAERLGGRPHGGAGLGLTITRELVELMGGHISLRSAPGQGTRVDIDLPMPVAAAPAIPSRAVPEKVSALPPLQILVVDDDEVNRMLITEVLTAAGARVQTAQDGLEALACVQRQPPSVVLMDWHMPGMDGLTATLKIRAGEAGAPCRDVPVIGLTANAFAEDREACLAAGMNAVLTKPVERQALLDEVAYWAQTASPVADQGPRLTPPG